jgi:hypothetical protein
MIHYTVNIQINYILISYSDMLNSEGCPRGTAGDLRCIVCIFMKFGMIRKEMNYKKSYSDKCTHCINSYSDKCTQCIKSYSDKCTHCIHSYSDKCIQGLKSYSEKCTQCVKSYPDKCTHCIKCTFVGIRIYTIKNVRCR